MHFIFVIYVFQQLFSFLLVSSLKETPERIVNQFPFETILTNKDQMAEVARKSMRLGCHVIKNAELENRGPLWLPTTFNLNTELSQFIKYFTEREKRYCVNYLVLVS